MINKQKLTEKIIEVILAGCGALCILTTLGILIILLKDSIDFFSQVSMIDFLTDSQWTPLFEQKHFGIRALLSGTILTTGIAMFTALPMGLIIAIYLSEYAPSSARSFIKPFLELLAAVPTVVYGYFALTFLTPLLQKLIPGLAGFNALSAGIIMGVMLIPLIASFSEDALQAVPDNLREGSLALGASRLQTSLRVIVPAAYSGIIVAVILSISRSIGETMIVAIAAGQQPRLTFNPLASVETVTTYIVQISKGDAAQGSLEYKTIFAAGLSLFILTFLLNSLSYNINKRFTERYE